VPPVLSRTAYRNLFWRRYAVPAVFVVTLSVREVQSVKKIPNCFASDAFHAQNAPKLVYGLPRTRDVHGNGKDQDPAPDPAGGRKLTPYLLVKLVEDGDAAPDFPPPLTLDDWQCRNFSFCKL